MTVLIRPQGLTSLLRGRLGNTLLWLLGLVHLAALVVFTLTVLSMTTADAAQDDASCRGNDIVAEMQKTDPQAYKALEAEAAQTKNGKGAFWKIEKPGKPASWLLGTMHISDPRVLEMPKGAKEAFAASDVVIVESDEITNQQQAMAKLLAKPELSMFTDGSSITDLLSKDDVQKLESGLAKRGIPLNAVMKMKPWILSSFVALPACEYARKAKGVAFLDMKLATDALDADKTLVGLETVTEQFTALSDLPMSFHVRSLVQMLQLGDRLDDMMGTMVDLYLKGEIGMIMPMMKIVTGAQDAELDEGNAAFEQRVITDRNRVMADRAAPHLDEGNVFMAVGALHLPGDEGVIELLRQKGFVVTVVR